MLESVVNISEGRDAALLEGLAAAAGPLVLDVHRDAGHNRSVFTLAGPDRAQVQEGVRRLAAAAVGALDLRGHEGAHPRFGVLDVVPFVPLSGSGMEEAVAERDGFARWAGEELGLPCFLYGPERSLPDVRKRAFSGLAPDTGPPAPHPTAGACAVGARPVMLAWNLWLAGQDRGEAARLAAALRGPGVRALAFSLPGGVQLSFNLVDPLRVGPAAVYDAAVAAGARVARAELVGLTPREVLERTERSRWEQLGLGPERTIEARLG